MRVDVVGETAVTGSAGVVSGFKLGGRRAHLVLVALALEGGPLSGSRLADLVWDGAPPTTWPVALRGVVGGLRAVLEAVGAGGQSVVATVPGGYRLGADVSVDVLEAEADLREGGRLSQTNLSAAERRRLHQLTALRGDDLMTGLSSHWLEVHRERIDELARRALERTVQVSLSRGDSAQAVGAARQLVAFAELDERSHRCLIAALADAGDRTGAVHAFETCRRLLAEDLGVEPMQETVEVYLHALGEGSNPSPAAVPRPSTSFRGREDETRSLVADLGTPGLVSLVGPGGVGKSRLVAEVVLGLKELAPVVRWVALESVTQDALVASTVAMALGVTPAEDPHTSLVADLSPRGPTLLVIDGCEVALDGAATLADYLVTGCPELVLLVTSRVPLGLSDERVHHLAPWPVPVVDGVADPPSPVLYVLLDRIRESGGTMTLEEAAGPNVTALMRHTAGLPLAIELVAAQLAVTGSGDLADQFDRLMVSPGDPVRGVATSSYALLSGEEATVFRRFAVLDGSVGLSLAQDVLSDEVIARPRIVRILSQLASYGLLRADRTGHRWRWSQDDELHRYARELLAEHGEEATAFARLAHAVHALLPDDARAAPTGYADRVTDMLASVRSLLNAALEGRADATVGLELAFRLHRYWASTSVGEGRFWLERLLEADRRGSDSSWVPYATYALGYLEYWSGDSDRAIPRLGMAADLLTDVDDAYVARSLVFLAGLLDDTDRGHEAVATIRRSIGIARELGPEISMPTVMGLGSLLSERGDPEAAEHAQRAIELCRLSDSVDQLRMALPTAAMICWLVGAVDLAETFVTEGMSLHAGGPRIAKVVLYSAAAGLALAAGDAAGAEELATAADRDGTELGVERELPLVRCILARALLELGDLDGAADRVGAALDAGLSIAFDFPLALGLETAVLVLEAAGAGSTDERAALLAAATRVRRLGNRPAPATLVPPEPDDLITAASQAEPPDEDPRVAARLALKILSEI